MSRIIDNLIAYRVLSMLVKPFTETEAYKLGIIDATGKNLIKSSRLETTDQRNAYTYLHRLVFNMKKIINKLPGGENKLKSLVAALFLVKEYYETNDRSLSLMEDRFNRIMSSDALLVEETLTVNKFFSEEELDEDGGAPTNSTGAAVSTDLPVIKQKYLNKYKKKNAGVVTLMTRVK